MKRKEPVVSVLFRVDGGAGVVFAYVERSFFWRSPLLLFPDFPGT